MDEFSHNFFDDYDIDQSLIILLTIFTLSKIFPILYHPTQSHIQ